MEQLEISAATEADLGALLALIEGAYRGDSARRGWTHEADLLGGQRTDEEALAEIVRDPQQAMLVARAGKTVVGCVQLAARGGGTAYLGMLSVDPSSQGSGLGRRLIEAAEREAAARFGARRIEMTVIEQRAELIAYYVRRGYAATGERRPFPLDDPRFGIPRTRALAFVVLAKPIGPASEEQFAQRDPDGAA